MTSNPQETLNETTEKIEFSSLYSKDEDFKILYDKTKSTLSSTKLNASDALKITTVDNLKSQSSEFHNKSNDFVPLRTCWICLATEEEDNEHTMWVHPCKCDDSIKWAHHRCVFSWIDSKPEEDEVRSITCRRCNYEFKIEYPEIDKLSAFFKKFEHFRGIFDWFVICSATITTVYWTAVSFGTLTLIQFCGFESGFNIIEKRSSHFLIIFLPTIPIVLLFSRNLPWEAIVMRYFKEKLKNSCESITSIIINRDVDTKVIFKANSKNNEITALDNNDADIEIMAEEIRMRKQLLYEHHLASFTEEMSITRLLSGAIFLPTISSLIGYAVFRPIKSVFLRTLVGGMTYLTVKGLLKIYLKHEQFIRQSNYRILDYTAANIQEYKTLMTKSKMECEKNATNM